MKAIFDYAVAGAIVATGITACASNTAKAQTPARWSISAGPLKAGTIGVVHVQAELQPGWHIYSITQPAGGPIPTRITVPAEQPFEIAGRITPSPAPRVAFDSAFHMNVELHEKAVGFAVPVRSTPSGATHPDSIHVNVRYQVCNATLCYPPQTAKLAAPIPGLVR